MPCACAALPRKGDDEMDLTQLIVTIGGVALIGLTLWFFFGAKSRAKPPAGKGSYSCPTVCGMKLVRDDAAAGR